MPKELDLTANQLACVRQIARHGSAVSPRAWPQRTLDNLQWYRKMIRPRTLGDGPGGDWMVTELGEAALELARQKEETRIERRRNW